MKQLELLLSVGLAIIGLSLGSCCPFTGGSQIKVGVFQGLGADTECVSDAMEALKIDKDIIPQLITAKEIMNGKLDELDALVFAGGSGSQQMSNMGSLVQAKVLEFVRDKGKGVVGICAGSYILSDTPDYTCLRLCPAAGTDLIHDSRGHDLVKFSLTEEGKKLFPELKDMKLAYMQYFEGPVLIPSKSSSNGSSGSGYTSAAIMESDVHLQNDAPANMTNGKPMLLNAKAGKGRVFLCISHPENTPGMRWMVPRMVRWTVNRELDESNKIIGYSSSVVRPNLYTKESLFDENLKNLEGGYFRALIFGKSADKIKAMDELVNMRSWGAKERFTGLLRDEDSNVRLKAAETLVHIEHTAAFEDLKISALLETDLSLKKKLDDLVKRMGEMCNSK